MVTKEKMLKLYVEKDMGLVKISRHLGIGIRRIRTLLTKYEIPSRPFSSKGRKNMLGRILSPETKAKISKVHIGMKCTDSAKEKIRARHKGWYKDSHGYIWIRSIGHPMGYKHGGEYVKRANLILEKKIGRYMTNEELAHHINNIRDDDRPENLELMSSPSKHNSLTAKERWKSGELRNIICKERSK